MNLIIHLFIIISLICLSLCSNNGVFSAHLTSSLNETILSNLLSADVSPECKSSETDKAIDCMMKIDKDYQIPDKNDKKGCCTTWTIMDCVVDALKVARNCSDDEIKTEKDDTVKQMNLICTGYKYGTDKCGAASLNTSIFTIIVGIIMTISGKTFL